MLDTYTSRILAKKILNYLLYKNVGNIALQRKIFVHKVLLYLDMYKHLDLISCKNEIVVTGSSNTDVS